MSIGPYEFAIEELQERPVVVGLGQGVDNREPVDFFVILGLDVAACEKSIDAVADAQTIAVAQWCRAFDHAIIDKCAVGAAQIADGDAALGGLDAGMATRNRVIMDADIAIFATADQKRPVGQGVALPHRCPGRIDMNEAGVGVRGDRPAQRRHPSFGDRLFHRTDPANRKKTRELNKPGAPPDKIL